MINRVATFCILFVTATGIYSQDNAPEPGNVPETEEPASAQDTQKIPSELRKDSETLSEIINELRQYREEDNDSDAQKRVKQAKIRKLLISLNKSHGQKRMDFYATKVISVDRFQTLTQLGNTQYARWTNAVARHDESRVHSDMLPQKQLFKKVLDREFWKLYHTSCNDCFRDSARHIVEYNISDMYNQLNGVVIESQAGKRERVPVIVMREIANDDEVISARIGTFQAITGKVSAIFYSGGKQETLIIYIE